MRTGAGHADRHRGGHRRPGPAWRADQGRCRAGEPGPAPLGGVRQNGHPDPGEAADLADRARAGPRRDRRAAAGGLRRTPLGAPGRPADRRRGRRPADRFERGYGFRGPPGPGRRGRGLGSQVACGQPALHPGGRRGRAGGGGRPSGRTQQRRMHGGAGDARSRNRGGRGAGGHHPAGGPGDDPASAEPGHRADRDAHGR